MSTQMGDYQGAKRSRGGATASLRNAVRRPITGLCKVPFSVNRP